MKDSFDVVEDVKGLVNAPVITTMLGATGKIFLNERAAGRAAMIDIVINCLGVTNKPIQNGIGNVNVYVPTIISSGIKSADQPKLKALSKAIAALIDTQFRNDFQTWLEDTPTIKQDADGNYFVNIPFEYQSVQTDFKNI